MKLTLKDLKTGKSYDVNEHGAVLGRDKKSCEIPVRDESVSKRHARVFADNGAWMLEDMGSSNGTFFEQQAIVQPVALYEGAILSLAQRQFKVVYFAADAEMPGEDTEVGDSTSLDDDDRGFNHNDLSDPQNENYDDEDVVPPDPTPEAAPAPRPAPEPGPAGGRGPALETERRPSPAKKSAPARPKSIKSSGRASTGTDQAALLGSFFSGLAYMLKIVPLLLVNPVGTIRKSTEEQDVAALEKLPLAAFIAPALMTAAAIGQVFAFLALLIGGHFSFGVLIPGLPIALIGALIGAIIVGFIYHPVTDWIVTKLKGQSDPKSRSNYLAISMAAAVLTAVPSGIGAVLAAIPLPFIALLGPLLSLVATAISLFVTWTWIRFFGLIKWAQYVVLALGALAVLATLVNFVQITIASFKGGGSSGAAVVATGGGEAKGDDTELSAEQQETLNQSRQSGTPDETLETMRQAFLEQNRAMQIAQKAAAGAATGEGADDDGNAGAADDAKADDQADNADDSADTGDDKGAIKEENQGDEGAADGDKDSNDASDQTDSSPALKLPKPTRSPGASDYLEFAARYEDIEQALKAHPELIKKRSIVRPYGQLLKKRYDVLHNSSKKRSKPWEKKILARQRDLEMFAATRKLVDTLYKRIFAD